ncbi:ankyrin repeat domain-containing protein [Thioalkalivibrio sp. HK1]|uniref:ankyrin repeat domain-containing protein n=1 Tax=Thioalkalivibrio sp. HK1 TaxID=1469245 RepID=UPI00046FD9BC|nr:ankyrin repeat domain-containing protein [Thioalkalivibrio sp. HK1]
MIADGVFEATPSLFRPHRIQRKCRSSKSWNPLDAKENTPLHLASKKGDTDAIHALLEVGADDRVKNSAGQRANKMNDNANIKAMVENPGVHWPIKAYAVRNLSTAGADTSMRILCDDSKKCRVYLNCFDDGGNRFQGWIGDLEKQRNKTTTGSIAKKATLSLSSSELKSLVGASDDTGALDCALHSPRRITVQVWSIAISGKENMTAYRLSEDDTTHQEATVRFYYGDTSTPYVHFRCFADESQHCRDTEFRCVDDAAASRTTIEAGTVKRLHKHIVAVSDSTDTGTSANASASASTSTGADLPSSGNAKGWYSCQVSSSNPFMVYVTDDIRKGDSIFTMNSTAISME